MSDDSYLSGKIIPGTSVGKFKLGWTMDQVIHEATFKYFVNISDWESKSHSIEADSIKFFFDYKTKEIVQITVFDQYKGSFLNSIRIGTILSEIKDPISYEFINGDNDCGIEFPDFKGIIVHTQKWDDDTPIKFISIIKQI
ncbi:hypothetical protein H1230_19220 [Paenibacillus sp. 19GGS1-52]|uniref:hypothetical protein n=1 Tax=Paenibacillus sp. 19GGS1-52 TaxID=2758563 RepID=UPI001EFAA536|nr:hypothetical protein [Paenibacillus sp. 19GGS1-52]ULO05235.1 hypothetical protein H1230_19220 [Paenibacillus sp. 19GGS1-52]